jgi:excisionase family DNA binding protein
LTVLPTPNDQLLTVSQVAERLQVTAQTIRNWIDGGVLGAVRVGRAYRIRGADLDSLLDRAGADSRSLATQRDVWAPTSTRLAPRGVFVKLPSIWDEPGESAVPSSARARRS